MGNEEALQRVKEKRNILPTTTRREAIGIGYILRRCLLQFVIEGKIEERTEAASVV